MACKITFSRYPAAADLPEHGIVAGNWYWASDQELPDENGNSVRLIGQRFLQRQDADDGARPPRFAGNAYLVYLNCLAAGGTAGDCSYGACDREFCCELKFEIDCFGEFQGNGTECILPDCHEEGVCCDFGHAMDCIDMDLEPCLINQGTFVPDVTCGSGPCDGACCLWIDNVGIGCVESLGPFECRQLPGSEGAENVTHSLWRGPGSVCPAEDCNPDVEECCPGEGACCVQTGGSWLGDCEITTPENCLADSFPPRVFKGIGTRCTDVGICGGACCRFNPHGDAIGPGGLLESCFDIDDPSTECFLVDEEFQGPGTNCAENAADCGLCCLVDSATCGIVCDETLSQAECIAKGGTAFGPGAQCQICDTIRRACCIPPRVGPGNSPFGEPPGHGITSGLSRCAKEYRCVSVRNCIECANLGGLFHDDADCDTHPCVLTAGACCCPEGVCPSVPCPPGQPGECRCYHTLIDDCPSGCVWHGPGLGCHPDNIDPVPPSLIPLPKFCLWRCTSCSPLPPAP